MTNRSYPVVIVELAEEDGGGYLAYAPDLYGCQTDGETREEAAHFIEGAICEWIDEIRRLGREIPEPGSYHRKNAAALKNLEAASRQAIDAISRSASELERLREENSALQRQLSDLLHQKSEENHPWPIFPAIELKIKSTDLPH